MVKAMIMSNREGLHMLSYYPRKFQTQESRPLDHEDQTNSCVTHQDTVQRKEEQGIQCYAWALR